MLSGQEYLTAIGQFAPFVILIVLFYFMLIRPQKKRDKAERDMRNSIAVGDEISTIGGFIGRVVNIKDDVLTIESSSDRTKLKIYRWAIRGKEAEPVETVEAPKDADKDEK
ncbi:MAG: preprotein translocase subunit YajC [Agathobaculum sp.]|uniref:preprotein translocase subunit YajC n=1 Tax=Agathobaculum sp. TaxID=2048138 RepID=UPI0025C6163C|nr:preprotein translocase subunit YajC [Agathobaculum sp.]MCI7125587.1 preprotein translocase subunit YajC [Agathobaculum sp.]MDY3712252.1 preprotein translocase subunit YajC [Agathobaculum sp.]